MESTDKGMKLQQAADNFGFRKEQEESTRKAEAQWKEDFDNRMQLANARQCKMKHPLINKSVLHYVLYVPMQCATVSISALEEHAQKNSSFV